MVGVRGHSCCDPACCVRKTAEHQDLQGTKLLLEKPGGDADEGGQQVVQAHWKEKRISCCSLTKEVLTYPRLLGQGDCEL